MDKQIATCGITKRTAEVLLGAGIVTLGDLADFTPEQLLSIPGLGPAGAGEVTDMMGLYGITLAPSASGESPENPQEETDEDNS